MPPQSRPGAATVDTDALGEGLRLAKEGAESAADVLSGLTGVEIAPATTSVSVLTECDLRRMDDGCVGVTVELAGGFPGETLLMFDRGDADFLLDGTGTESATPLDAADRSSLRESAHLVVREYIDGLAARLGGRVNLSSPTYYDHLDEATLLADSPGSGALAFESRLAGDGVTFSLLTVPRDYAIEYLLSERPVGEAGAVPLSTLEAFDGVAREGAAEAASLLAEIAEIETTVETSRLRYLGVDAVGARLGDERVIGSVFGLNGGRDGFLAVLLDEASARTVTDAMVPVGGETVPIGSSAVAGVSRALASGFLDRWDGLVGDVALTSPATVEGVGTAVLDPVLRRIGRECDNTFIVEARLTGAETGLSCQLIALPAAHRLTAL
jgi:chemotaxis protein CheY-P-specific phosphatase CheC